MFLNKKCSSKGNNSPLKIPKIIPVEKSFDENKKKIKCSFTTQIFLSQG